MHINKKSAIKPRSKRVSKRVSKRSKSSPTRGWKPARNISSRRALKSKCGSRCFLLPSKHKFPICYSNCKPNCKGIVSSYVRAQQWKYPTVAKKAKSLINSYKCTKKSRSK